MAKRAEPDSGWIELIIDSLRGLRYGSVNIVVHDGRIVQIEKSEKHRFDGQAPAAAPAAIHAAPGESRRR